MRESGSVVDVPRAVDLDAHAERSSNYRKHTSANPLQQLMINRFHAEILDRIAELDPTSFLDAGCGEGFVASELLARLPGLQLTGCDADPDAVAVARERNPHAEFVVGNVLDLPFDDNSFDVVGCFEVMEHLPGQAPAAALAEYARVTKRAVVLSVPNEPLFSLANVARGRNLDIRPRGSDPDHKQFWTRYAFGQLVREQFDIAWLGGSFPWTICVATKRR